MRWTTKLSCDVKLCQEFQCQKLLKSDNYSSTYSQQYEWVFFFWNTVYRPNYTQHITANNHALSIIHNTRRPAARKLVMSRPTTLTLGSTPSASACTTPNHSRTVAQKYRPYIILLPNSALDTTAVLVYHLGHDKKYWTIELIYPYTSCDIS